MAARLEALEAVEAPVMPKPVDVQPLLDKIASLEEDLKAVNISNGGDDKLEEFKALAERLEASGNQDVSALKAENDRLSQLVSELNNRLTDVEAARVQMRSTGDNAQALIASLSSSS